MAGFDPTFGLFGKLTEGQEEQGLSEGLFGGVTDSLSKQTQPVPFTQPAENTGFIGPMPIIGPVQSGDIQTPDILGGSSIGSTSSVDSGSSSDDKIRSSISSSFDPIFSDFDRQLGNLPGQQSSQEGLVGSLFGSQGEGIEAARARGESQLAQSRLEAKQEKATSLRDLGENLRGAFKAGNLFLGTRGASDSSAANQLGFGLQKANLRRSSDIGMQAQRIFSDINQRQEQVQLESDNAIRDLGNWRAQQLVQIQQNFAAQRSAIQSAKATAQGTKAAALANLDQQLALQAQQALQALDQQSTSFASQIQQALDAQTAQNQAELQSINQQGVAPATPDLAQDPISGVQAPGVQQAGFSPFGTIGDDELQGQLSLRNLFGDVSRNVSNIISPKSVLPRL